MRRTVVAIENYQGTHLGHVGMALDDAGIRPIELKPYQGDPLPEAIDQVDALIILGGVQSALDDHTHPYYPALLGLIRDMAAADRPVLGICLGGQLIARALGGDNHLGSHLEYGYHPLNPMPANSGDPVFGHVAPASISFQWHEDSMSLPPGAIHLLTNDATEIQAFRFGRAVYGTQFHFEASTETARSWTEIDADRLDEQLPGWRSNPESDFETHGPDADAFGLDLARRWVTEMIAR